jgi:hypothetical protein
MDGMEPDESRDLDSRPAGRATVRVEASVPLLRGGLERVARLAGLTIVGSGEAASITLRSVEQQPSEAGVDVVAEGARITVTVSNPPPMVTWLEVHALLVSLLGQAEGAGR